MGGLGSRKLRVREVFAELPRVVAHASRGRDSSYFGLFSILGVVWLSFNALNGLFGHFCHKGLFGKLMGYGNSALF